MANALALPGFVQAGLKVRRLARLRKFMSQLDLPENAEVIDVGCGRDGRTFSNHVSPQWRITGVDLHTPELVRHEHPRFRYVQGNACDLAPFRDKQFDLCVSVGMLEHITGDAYYLAAKEMQRVAKSWMIVVPWRWAPIEPHYVFPLFGALSVPMKEWLIRHVLHRDRPEHFIQYLHSNFDWRSMAQYKRDFPGSRIVLGHTLDTMAIVGGEGLRR